MVKLSRNVQETNTDGGLPPKGGAYGRRRNVRGQLLAVPGLLDVSGLALFLNAPPDWERLLPRQGWPRWRQRAREYGAWRAAAAILAPSLPLRAGYPLAPETVRRFNRLATVCLVMPWLFETERRPHPERPLPPGGKRVTVAAFRVRDVRGEVLKELWHLLQSPARERLKRCVHCGAWFADTTKNRGGLYCSGSCRDKAWTREQRRAAGHSNQPRARWVLRQSGRKAQAKKK
jgi:hypothetical protein